MTSEPFKNWLSSKSAQGLAHELKRHYRPFSPERFLRGLDAELEPLSLKQRMHALKSRLMRELPEDPRQSFPILRTLADDARLEGFILWPVSQLIADTGLRHLPLALDTLRALTPRFSSEFTVRPFLIHEEKPTLAYLTRQLEHPDEHVRRWVSEGSRPLLPWGERIPRIVLHPKLTWPLLNALKADPAEYVRRSVANHVNDHAKHHADEVVRVLTRWRKELGENAPSTALIRHASRTLIKQGHPKALSLQGVRTDAKIQATQISIATPVVRLGGKLEVSLRLRNASQTKEEIIIDHEISLLKADGRHSQKVFKGSRVSLAAGEVTTLSFRIPLRPVTVRKYYAGKHFWAPQVNGKPSKRLSFELKL